MTKSKTKDLKDLYLKTLCDKQGNPLKPKTEELKIFFKNGKPLFEMKIIDYIPQKPKTTKTIKKST